MTNRVVFGALPGGGYGARVSRPGFNVLSTSLQPKQIAFDSRWNRAARVHMTGRITGKTTVNFGKTFPVCPLVYCIMTDTSGRYRTLSSGTGGSVVTTTSQTTITSPRYPATYLVVAI